MFRKMIATVLIIVLLCSSSVVFAQEVEAVPPTQEEQSSTRSEDNTSELSTSEASLQAPKDHTLGSAEEAEAAPMSVPRSVSNGSCGDELTWTLDTDSGVLTISGKGAMFDYDAGTAPWYSKRGSIQSVVMEDGVTILGSFAFQNCYTLASVSLPASLKQINSYCFQQCTALLEIELPEGLTEIGRAVFNLCPLKAIHLPATLTNLGAVAFYGCTALNTITVAAGNPAYTIQDGILYDIGITTLFLCPAGRTEPLVIPDTVTLLREEGLANCTKLTGLTIPDGLHWDYNALTFCNGLLNIHAYESSPNYADVDGVLYSKDFRTLVQFPCGRTGRYDIPEGTVTIGYAAFCRMENPMIVTMPDTFEVIDGSAFAFATGLTKLTLSAKLQKIYAHAFMGCENMENVVLPETLTLLGYDSFRDCNSITEIIIPSQITEIPSDTFYSCQNLKKVVLEGAVTHIYSTAFAFCFSLESINFPDELTYIAAYAFYACSALAEISLPPTVTSLGDYAFCDCVSLTKVMLSKGLQTIGRCAFYGTSLSQIVIPETVVEINDNAFSRCRQLSAVHFLGDAPKMGSTVFYSIPDTLVLYYIQGAQGWSSPTWYERPTALWSYTFSTTADCVNGGTETFQCKDCDLVYTRSVRAYGHSYGEWYLAVQPTQDAEGRWERICSVCAHVDAETIPVLTEAEQVPAVTNNLGRQNYSVWSATVKSYLVDNGDGSLSRVEATNASVTVERYDTAYQFLSRQVLPMELPLFGGFYEGTDYYFLVFGQTNPEEDDNTEVIRVVRYTKDWLRIGQASLYGANTYIPFDAGSLRMTQYRDMLYVHTCHEMYQSNDGYHHQANLIFSVSIPDMRITDQYSKVMNVGYGYVSHSFNQFVLTDGDKLLTLNHGDAYPRSAVIVQYGKPAGKETFTGSCTNTSILRFTGSAGYNATGASLGAFELTDSAYLTAGNSILQDGSVAFGGQRNIFLCVTPKGDIGSEETSLRWITSYDDGANIKVSTPHLVRIQGNRYLLLWTENEALRYVFVDDMGNTVSEIYKANIPLSDCKPIVWGNAVCWYVTQNSKPAFFSIPLDQPDAPQICAPTITVTLEPNGGMLENNTLAVSYGQPYGTLPVPQRKSAYQFLCWYPYAQYSDDAPAADRITADTIITTLTSHTLYAHWKYLSHTCVFEKEKVVPPNCTMGQVTYYACVHCDSYYCIIDGEPQHAWDDGVVTKQPTETESGLKTFTCALCNVTKVETILPTGAACDGGENCPSGKFVDVNTKEWYHPYVDYAVEHGLFGGTSENTFEPETAMTRAMRFIRLAVYKIWYPTLKALLKSNKVRQYDKNFSE